MTDTGFVLSSNSKPKKIRKLFSPQEDALLSQIMYQQPFQTWIAVADQLPGRTARQCRDRWVNYLSPSNKNGPWSHEEDKLLAEKYLEYGPQWTTIAHYFDGRSENNVKNRWYTYVKARLPSNALQISVVSQSKSITEMTPVMNIIPNTVTKITTETKNHSYNDISPRPKPLLPPITNFVDNINNAQTYFPTIIYPGSQKYRSSSVKPALPDNGFYFN